MLFPQKQHPDKELWHFLDQGYRRQIVWDSQDYLMPGISGQGEIATAKCSQQRTPTVIIHQSYKMRLRISKTKIKPKKKKNAGANNESKLETSDSLSNFVTHRNPKGFLVFFL